jgi:hypothetical protein
MKYECKTADISQVDVIKGLIEQDWQYVCQTSTQVYFRKQQGTGLREYGPSIATGKASR